MPATFISEYLRHTQIYESPTSFWLWSAYAMVATALGDRCNLIDGDNFIYPNMYVMFLAESSGHRKNRPVELPQQMFKLNPRIKMISGRASVQAILDELSQTETHNGVVIKANAATFFAEELSANIVNDAEGMKILTTIYDFKPVPFMHRLRHGAKFDLDKVVFTMLSASNEAMLKGLFDQTVIEGGFLARTILIRPNEMRPPNSLLRVDPEERKASRAKVVEKLNQLYKLNGSFKMEEAAIDEHDKWYNDFRTSYMKIKESTGFIGRLQTHVKKLAMILAANELMTCVLKRHMEDAIEQCLGLRKNYERFTMNHAKTDIGNAGGLILSCLLDAENNTLTRKALIRANWQNFDAEHLEKAVQALDDAGYITQVMARGSELAYKLTPLFLEKLKGPDQKTDEKPK